MTVEVVRAVELGGRRALICRLPDRSLLRIHLAPNAPFPTSGTPARLIVPPSAIVLLPTPARGDCDMLRCAGRRCRPCLQGSSERCHPGSSSRSLDRMSRGLRFAPPPGLLVSHRPEPSPAHPASTMGRPRPLRGLVATAFNPA
ncbi:hypothetical protein [Thiococcus pfennigii]|uniref:hypothetical protein n=1 Tax=Thiococcus pfennigii TaxID=1057 RepID=UPI001F5B3C83|nr:hypothetical protein [Thiococcus pfennigii]